MGEPAVKTRRGRGGGGAARRAERTSVKFETEKTIERNIPYYDVLDEATLEIIERNADVVLEEIGVEFRDDPEAIAIGLDRHFNWDTVTRLYRLLADGVPCYATNPDIAGRSICVLTNVTIELSHEALAEAHDIPIGFSLWIEI
mgnify:CR=1 FL=1